jgi:LmbE family N-acetylglucosaminyl deacetylase
MEFGCAGTLALWADAGADVTLCIATDGSTGTQDRDLMGERLSQLRKKESRAAADVIGINEVVWLDYQDGYVEYTLDLRRDIARVFRRYKPHRFVVMEPAPTVEDRFINHPDHRAIGQASLDVSMTAGTTPGHFPELLDEGFDPWRGLREVWITGPGQKPRAVDISRTIDRKIEALKRHQSQVGDDIEQIAGFVRRFTAEAGQVHGYDYAETFSVISQGPGFHAGEQDEEVDLGDVGDLAQAPSDPRA